jgi:hypothetical protein
MKLRFLLIFLFFIPNAGLFSQQVREFYHLDRMARMVPDSAEQNTGALSSYFLSQTMNQQELVRLIYCWIANNIAYDVESMFTTYASDDANKLAEKTMSGRKAVCQGYAELFHDLSSKVGIESYVVHGYTRQNGEIARLPHAWVVAVIDKKWVFFDPTWAAGFVEKKRFVKRFSDEYFMVPPSRNILTHMPYDPIWQCLSFPFSSSDFYNGKRAASSDTTFFSFPDSIEVYCSLSKNQQNIACLRRVENNGIVNNALSQYARYLLKSIEIYNLNREIDARNQEVEKQRIVYEQFNSAVNHYNLSVSLFGDYLNYFNRQFTPIMSDSAIWEMVDICDKELQKSRSLLTGLKDPDENLENSISALTESMLDMQTKIQEQKNWLKKYLETPIKNRSRLFKIQIF